jgi:hypothetical protein
LSLYRQPGRAAARTVAAAAAVALLAGGGIGYAIGAAGGEEETSLADALAALRTDVRPIANGLELVGTEYPQAVRGGRVVAATEYAAARADVQRARDTLAAHAADLRALAPGRAAALRRTLARLAAAVDARAGRAEVDRIRAAAAAQLAVIVPR